MPWAGVLAHAGLSVVWEPITIFHVAALSTMASLWCQDPGCHSYIVELACNSHQVLGDVKFWTKNDKALIFRSSWKQVYFIFISTPANFHLSKSFIFLYNCLCVCEWARTCVCRYPRSWKNVWGLLMWVLWTELGSSARAVCALTHRIISRAPTFHPLS